MIVFTYKYDETLPTLTLSRMVEQTVSEFKALHPNEQVFVIPDTIGIEQNITLEQIPYYRKKFNDLFDKLEESLLKEIKVYNKENKR